MRLSRRERLWRRGSIDRKHAIARAFGALNAVMARLLPLDPERPLGGLASVSILHGGVMMTRLAVSLSFATVLLGTSVSMGAAQSCMECDRYW